MMLALQLQVPVLYNNLLWDPVSIWNTPLGLMICTAASAASKTSALGPCFCNSTLSAVCAAPGHVPGTSATVSGKLRATMPASLNVIRSNRDRRPSCVTLSSANDVCQHPQPAKMLITKTHYDIPTKLDANGKPIRIFVIAPTVPSYPNAKFPGECPPRLR